MTADELELMLQPNERPAAKPRVTIPTRDKFTSFFGFGPMPATKIFSAQALVDEHNAHGPSLEPLTTREQVVLLPAEAKAQRRLDRQTQGTVEKLVTSATRLHGQVDDLCDAVDRLSSAPLIDPVGATLTPPAAQLRHDALDQQIATEHTRGDRKHDHNTSHDGWKRIAGLCADWLVLFLAFTILFNVAVQDMPFSTVGEWIPAISAAVFATLGTVFVAVVTKGFGRSHRRFKTGDGSMPSPRTTVGRRILLERILVFVIIAALGTLMAVRVINDGIDAEAFMPLIVAVAVLLPLLIMGSAYLIYADTVADGSLDTDELRHRSASLLARNGQLQRINRQITSNYVAAGLQVLKLARMLQHLRTTTTDLVTKSARTRCVLVARSYCGRTGTLPPPTLDWNSLELAEQQLQTLADRHQHLLRSHQDGTEQ
jgi:hypothetical protein